MEIRTAGRRRRGLLILAAAVFLTAGGAAAVRFCRGQGFFLPRWAKWQERSVQDAAGACLLRLEDRSVSVFCGDRLLWTSPEGVKVQDVLSCDIDRDGAEELLLLCWKIGSYGNSRPFWEKQNDRSWTQHLFVYNYGPDGVSPQWMSSDMGTDAATFAIAGSVGELTAEELMMPEETPETALFSSYEITQERCPYLRITDPDGGTSLWFWDSWGFTRVR